MAHKKANNTLRKTFTPKRTREIKSSMRKIFRDIGQGDLLNKQSDGSSMLSVFPKDAEYEAQNKNEIIVYIVRQHVIVMLLPVFQFLGMVILPIVIILILASLDVELLASSSSVILALVIFWYIFTLTFAMQAYLRWYYNVFIITNERIIDIDVDSITSSRTSGSSIDKIEDVSIEQTAFLQNVFDFGNVSFQTAASRGEFEMPNVPRPRILQDTILDLSVGMSGNNKK